MGHGLGNDDVHSSIDLILQAVSAEPLRAREPDDVTAMHNLHTSWYRLIHLLLGGEHGWKTHELSPQLAAAHHVGAILDVIEHVLTPLDTDPEAPRRPPRASGRAWLIDKLRDAAIDHIIKAEALNAMTFVRESSIRLCWATQVIVSKQAGVQDVDDPRGAPSPSNDAADVNDAYHLLISCAVATMHVAASRT